MSQEKIDILQRALDRERKSRKQAEKILEEKSAELYQTNLKLENTNTELASLYKETNSQLQGVFENIVDAYVVIDLWGNILKMNNAAIELLQYNSNEEDVNLMSMVPPEEVENSKASFKILSEQGVIRDLNIKIRTKNNEAKIVHINASLIYDDDIAVAAQGIVRDITDLKNLQIQKESLLHELEKSNDELQEYAHIVSHDLKSPLRSINALVNWIKEDNDGKFDAQSLQNFELVETTLEKMEQLITDILTYSSIGTNKHKNSTVNLDTLVNDLITIMFVPDHIKITKEELPTVSGDAIKLQQLFQNLIGNAIKFIDKEQGKVNISFTDLNTHYQFAIADNGIGIDKQYHNKIFKIFNSLNKSKESTGIGLSIVKKIVEIHQGHVWLESESKKGSIFYFTLKK